MVDMWSEWVEAFPPKHTNSYAMLHYCKQFSVVLSQISQQVKAALSDPVWGPHHNLKPGDWVIVPEFWRKYWRSKT